MDETPRLNAKMAVTTDELAGYRIVRSLGIVEGLGMTPFTGLPPPTRENRYYDVVKEAFRDMLERATKEGATAIVGIRYSTPSSDRERIILVYGTAVVVERLKEEIWLVSLVSAVFFFARRTRRRLPPGTRSTLA